MTLEKLLQAISMACRIVREMNSLPPHPLFQTAVFVQTFLTAEKAFEIQGQEIVARQDIAEMLGEMLNYRDALETSRMQHPNCAAEFLSTHGDWKMLGWSLIREIHAAHPGIEWEHRPFHIVPVSQSSGSTTIWIYRGTTAGWQEMQVDAVALANDPYARVVVAQMNPEAVTRLQPA